MSIYQIRLWDGKHFHPWISVLALSHIAAREIARELGANGMLCTYKV